MAEEIAEETVAQKLRSADIAEQMRLEKKRTDKMREVAELRWQIAQTQHKTELGEFLDFDRWPFLVEIYKNDAPDIVLIGSAGWGKTEFLICDDSAKAACDLRVFHVMDNFVKRDRFVLGRIDPCFASSAFYSGMLKHAKNKNREMDSARFKHFGDGSINFVGSNSDSDFSTYRADTACVDEHQLCDKTNLRRIFHRMTGSDFGFITLVGNPRGVGTAENQNLHWEFLQTDQRQWHIPCPTCNVVQILGWWSHFIEETKNEYGAITEVKVRDENWDPEGSLEFRPICTNCGSAMYRLSRDGKWVATVPGKRRRGYQLSSLYNPTAVLSGNGPKSLLTFYRKGLHNPNDMADFVNDQLGMPHSTTGSSITEDMLQMVSTGKAAGVQAYSFVHAGDIAWRKTA
jgi:hypothetical protein